MPIHTPRELEGREPLEPGSSLLTRWERQAGVTTDEGRTVAITIKQALTSIQCQYSVLPAQY